MHEISVIVPCYNAEKTIIQSLQSLSRQTFKDFEVIIIDDGSNDNSVDIIYEYMKKSKLSIKLIHQENKGVSIARNVGLENAKGKYISFLDADDEYTSEFLEILHFEIEKSNTDLAFCRYVFLDSSNQYFNDTHSYQSQLLKKYNILDIYLHKRIEHVNFVGGLYRNSVIKKYNIIFPDNINYGEDSQFFCTYVFHSERGGNYIKKVMYKYILQSTSATQRICYEKVQNIEAYKNIVSIWKKDKNFSYHLGEILVARSVWSVTKDFAIYNQRYFMQLQKDYDVKYAMRVMMKDGDECSIRLASMLFLINPLAFLFTIKCCSKCLMCINKCYKLKSRNI